MSDSKKFQNRSNPHHGASISQSGQQRRDQGPKPGQQGANKPSYGTGTSQPSQADKRAQAMRHGGSQKKGR